MLLKEVLSDESAWCHVSATQDLKTIQRRVEHEGISFLTISLTNYGKDFEKSLAQGYVGRQSFLGFTRKGELPLLFGGFLDLVFDRASGRLLDVPSIDAIRSVRQLTLMFGKVKIECSKERIDKAVDSYIKCEQEVRLHDSYFSSYQAEFVRMSHLLFGEMFSKLNLKIQHEGVLPKHGKGSTADGFRGNAKYLQTEWPLRLEEEFPAMEYLSPRWAEEFLDSVNFLEPGQERPVKVITVPKTLKTPRIIAEEPVAMQYVQQGILELMSEATRADDIARWLICSDSQDPNRDLARKGSIDGSFATLDLSEASDRVSNQHVRALLTYHPIFARAVDACRSRKADVPGYGVIRLAKFASMGSALCFPFEAIVFATVVFLGIQDALNRPIRKSDVMSLQGQVRVYGDDIIVPVDYANHVVARLETFGFRVNRSKSFWTGLFRESCGKEYYAGEDVSLTRLRRVLPTPHEHARSMTQRKKSERSLEIVSLVSFRNRMFKSGHWQVTRWLDPLIEEFIPFPAGLETSPALAKLSSLGYETHGTNHLLQRPFITAAVKKDVTPKDNLEGDGALMKFFLKRGLDPFADKRHLERAGRPVSVDIKIRNVSPF